MDVNVKTRLPKRWCFVPMCTNTTVSTPEKYFVHVPVDMKRRKAWIKAARRDDKPTPGSNTKSVYTAQLFCCQDHFDMDEDMESFLRFKLMGGHLQSKKHVVPHIFHCQPPRSVGKPPRSLVKKRNAIRLLNDAMNSKRATPVASINAPAKTELPDSNSIVDSIRATPVASISAPTTIALPDSNSTADSTRVASINAPVKTELPDSNSIVDSKRATPVASISAPTPTGPYDSDSTNDAETTFPQADGGVDQPIMPAKVSTRDVGVQARPHFRSKATMCTASQLGILTSTKTSPFKKTMCDANMSPINVPYCKATDLFADSSSSDSDDSKVELSYLKRPCLDVDAIYTDSSAAETSEDSSDSEDEERDKFQRLRQTRMLGKKHPDRYLGVPKTSAHIFALLADTIMYQGTWLEAEDVVLLVLRKMKLNESFGIMGDNFGISASHAARLFTRFAPAIAACLETLRV